jgi:hypothetical protein
VNKLNCTVFTSDIELRVEDNPVEVMDEQEMNKNNFEILPDELVIRVYSYCDIPSIGRLVNIWEETILNDLGSSMQTIWKVEWYSKHVFDD